MSDKYTTTSSIKMPVEQNELISWLRLSNTQDTTITDLLTEKAFYDLEDMTNHLFVDRDMELTTGDVIYSSNLYPYIEINRTPVNSVTDAYTLQDGVYTSISGSYVVDLNGDFTRIYITDTVTYDSDTAMPYKVVFNVGETTTPADFKVALLQMVAYSYENRGDVLPDGSIPYPKEVETLISRYRKITVV